MPGGLVGITAAPDLVGGLGAIGVGATAGVLVVLSGPERHRAQSETR